MSRGTAGEKRHTVSARSMRQYAPPQFGYLQARLSCVCDSGTTLTVCSPSPVSLQSIFSRAEGPLRQPQHPLREKPLPSSAYKCCGRCITHVRIPSVIARSRAHRGQGIMRTYQGGEQQASPAATEPLLALRMAIAKAHYAENTPCSVRIRCWWVAHHCKIGNRKSKDSRKI